MSRLPNGDNPWILLLEIGAVALTLWFLFFRRQSGHPAGKQGLQRIEVKLSGILNPEVVHAAAGQPAQLIIHRYDREPSEELFEIEELGIYELLPALHTTVIAFNPQKRGNFSMILAGERKAGTMVVD